jgi:hypothetical protein
VILFVAHASANCFGCQGSSGSEVRTVLLTPTGPDTFEYPFASAVASNIPADSDVTIYVEDYPVSTTAIVARDIYVNGLKVAVDQFGQAESGHFRLRSDGTVY